MFRFQPHALVHGVHRLGELSVSVQGRPGLLNPAGQRELRRRHDNVRHVTGGQDALDGGLAREVGHAVSVYRFSDAREDQAGRGLAAPPQRSRTRTGW
jgi:hypothetical protein